MAYDLVAAERIRGVLDRLPLLPNEITGELRMFGGLCFSLNGKMLVGVGKGQIMVRMETDDLERALEEGFATPMDFTGKPLRNFAYLTEAAMAADEDLFHWIERSAAFVRKHMTSERPRNQKKK